MVGIQGLGGVPEPKSERPAKVRSDREATARETTSSNAEVSAKDDVNISVEAKAAAEVGRLLQLSKTQEEIRADRVAAAKERIARGDYRNPEVVAKVAERLLKFLS